MPTDGDTTGPIERLLTLLAEHYIFPDKAAQAAAVIGQHNAAGGYQGLDEDALSDLLTRQLYEVCRDKHLRISPRDPAEAERRLQNQFRRSPELENYGIARVERLAGNVGLIDIRSLPNPDLAGRSIAAAMSLVAHTDALIFDVRQNRGGWPECVIFWNSYLFPDGDTLLNTIEERGKKPARQFWALAAVPGERYLDRPVYVLTSGTTFSGGEEFAYNLQARRRATLLGEVTGGGAHPVAEFSLTPTLQVHIPNARSVNPVTDTNWEGTGVRPDIEVPAGQAPDPRLPAGASARRRKRRGRRRRSPRGAARPEPGNLNRAAVRGAMSERQGSAAGYGVWAQRGIMVTMRDGVRLATDVYRPAIGGVPAPGPFPCIVERTPYSRQGPGAVAAAKFFCRHGYAAAVQDVRGRYDSGGEWYPFAREAPDGYDTVEWLAAQDWCDGQVATAGLSYSGSDQHALATLAPPHLAAVFASEAMSSYHTGSMRQGGAAELRFLVYALWMAAEAPAALADPALRAAVLAESAAAEDWLRRTPLKPGVSVLRHFPALEQWALDIVRHGDYDDYWKQRGYTIEEYYDEYPDVPVYLLSGWYDTYTRATAENFGQLRRRHRAPVRMIIGPWIHGVESMSCTFAGDADFGIDAPIDYDGFRLAFYDAALRGLDTGALDGPPVRLFVMGGGSGRRLPDGRLDHGGRWRDEDDWPLARARSVPYHLHPDGTLRAGTPPPPGPASQTYRYDPAHPVPTVGGSISAATAVMPAGGFDQRGRPELLGCEDELPLNARHDVLTFQTEPLPAPIEVTGPLTVRVWVSASTPDTDLTAKLIDVYPPGADYPDGYALNIQDGILRLRYRAGRDRPLLMNPGEICPVEVVLAPTSNLFAAGHRIRLDLSSSNFPRFDLNPNTGGPLGVSGRGVPADVTIHHDAAHPSHLLLPVVPA